MTVTYHTFWFDKNKSGFKSVLGTSDYHFPTIAKHILLRHICDVTFHVHVPFIIYNSKLSYFSLYLWLFLAYFSNSLSFDM